MVDSEGFNIWNITNNPSDVKEAQQNLKIVLNWERLGYTERHGVSTTQLKKEIRLSIVEVDWNEKKAKLNIHLAKGLSNEEKEILDTHLASKNWKEKKEELDI